MNFSIKISVSSPRVAWRFDDARSCLTTGKWVIYCPRSSKLVLLFIFFTFSFLFFLSLLLPRQPRLAVPTNTKRPLSRNNFSGLGASSCHVSHGGVVPRVAYIRKKPNAIKRSLRISQFASQTNERRIRANVRIFLLDRHRSWPDLYLFRLGQDETFLSKRF